MVDVTDSCSLFTRPLQTAGPRRDLSPSNAQLFSGMLVTDPVIEKVTRRINKVKCFYLGNIDLSSVHKLKDSSQVLKWNIFQNDDRVFCWVFLEQGLEVGGARGQDHLVSLGALAITCESHVTK